MNILDAIRTSPLAAAKAYINAGLSIIPVGTDGRKQPAFGVLPRVPDPHRPGKTKGTWKPFEHRLATPEEIEIWFGGRNPHGIGVAAGPISKNLAVLDFERRSVFARWGGLLTDDDRAVLSHCPVVITPGKVDQNEPGVHVYGRLTAPAGGGVFAMDAAGNCSIEIRGQGNYVLGAGSPVSSHPKRLPYRLVRLGWLDGQPFEPMPIEVFNRLCLYAAKLNEYSKPAPSEVVGDRSASQAGYRPGDYFNAQVSWSDILKPAGWSLYSSANPISFWCRPGKKPAGTSATTGFCRGPSGNDLLWVFSASAAPFQANTSYSKFAAYALLNHRGDFTAATRALGAAGYGSQRRLVKGVRS